MTELGRGAEFDAIRDLVARWGDVASGIGDDAAVLEVPRGERVVVSVDTAIDGLHFRQGWLSAREIGYRAVAAALSDLAAMGARPLGVLVALAVPGHWRAAIGEIGEGIGEACRDNGTRVIGGNTSAAGELSITSTVIGSAYVVLARDALEPGDTLYVTGALGASGAVVRALEAGDAPDPMHRAHFARPTPRLREARWLAGAGARAAIDVSDGLAADLGHLAAASGRTLEVDLDAVPVAPGVDVEDAIASGEEYELVVGSPRELDAAAFQDCFGVRLTRIGRVLAGKGEVVLTRRGVRVASPSGYDHFSS